MASGGHLGYGDLGTSKCKILAEMDSSYQKTSKKTYCTTFCDNYYKKVSFLICPLVAILELCKFRELPKVAILATKLDLF